MFSSDLAIVSNRASVTLPGASGSVTYSQVTGPSGQLILRRVPGTASTTPQTMTTSHQLTGKGFAQRLNHMVKFHYRALNTDLSLTGGVVPEAEVYVVIRRPVQSGGVISDSVIGTMVGSVCDFLSASGNLAKILNQEG